MRHSQAGGPGETIPPPAENGYDGAHLFPRSTGLAHTVWLSPRNARHDLRVKVCKVPGDRMIVEETISVAVRPEPHIIGDETLPAKFWEALTAWVKANEPTIIEYWEGRIDSLELAGRIKKT